MRPTDNLKQKLRHIPVKLNPEVDEAVLSDLSNRLSRVKDARPKYRVMVPYKLTKLAIAAALVIAILLGISYLGGSMDGANVAWAEVVRHIEQVDHVHFYYIETEQNSHSSIREGWYAHGKIKTREYDAEQTIDNGSIWVVVDEHDNVIKKGKSNLAEYDNVFDALTKDILSYRFFQFDDKIPVSVGSDFLIYEFEPPESKVDWIDRISVMIGRNSLMPVQIKTYIKKEKWSMNHLLVFDYEAPPKSEDFFKLPTQVKSPHGVRQVALNGEEVAVELKNVPGVKKAMVRLHAESKGFAGKELVEYKDQSVDKPAAFLEISFVTDEDYKSHKAYTPLWLDKCIKGVSEIAMSGPDNKYDYIVYTSVLRASGQDNVLRLELSCWLKTKQLNQSNT